MTATQSVTRTTTNGMASIQRIAKVTGVLYLVITGLAGLVHFYVPGRLYVTGDTSATVNNILASPSLFRWSIASELVLLLCEIAVCVLLYMLLRPVNHTLSLIAAAARLAMATIHGANLLASFFVLLLVGGTGYIAVIEPAQAGALAMLFIDASSYGFTIGVVFLALHATLLAYLIYASGYFPKILGILFVFAAAGYAIDAFGHVILPGYVTGAAYIAIPIALAEIALPLWLLFRGVNSGHWLQRTQAPMATLAQA